MPRTLYLCYFGLREPLVQTQVLPYLREIRKDNVDISIITFEPDLKKKWTLGQIETERTKLAAEGIDWHCLAYHKWPSVPATLYDIFRGTMFVKRFIREQKPDILHGRVHLPTLMGAIARKLSRHKPKLLFDIRGFFPEEYTDAGIWPEGGWIYRGAKRIERWLLNEADGFVVLTENARVILFPESKQSGFDRYDRPIAVIPCCVDFERRFANNLEILRKNTREELGINDRLVVTHLGALGGLYLTVEIADFLAFTKSQEPTTFALFLTQTDPELIIPHLKARGFTENDYFVRKVAPTEIQKYLSAADIALSFVRAGYATASRSPTKIPEYLACELPVIANKGVGDVDNLIKSNEVGAVIEDFSRESYLNALRTVRNLVGTGAKFQYIARREFDLAAIGGERYRQIYRQMLNGDAE